MSVGPPVPSAVSTTTATEIVPVESSKVPALSVVEFKPANPLYGPGLWIRVGLALTLLCASAAARQWQSRRVDQTLRDGRIPPFSLKEIPETLGDWEGTSTVLDPHIARATGATDSIFRSYQHRRTGQKVDLVLLFGPSTEMYIHTPENCYPAGGWTLLSGPVAHQVLSAAKQVPFLSLVYYKGEGGTVQREEVYYTWRYSGRWTPYLVTQKGFERIPGMFKVHVQRSIQKASEIDLLDIGNPIEAFLAALMPEIDARIAKSHAKPHAAAKPKKS